MKRFIRYTVFLLILSSSLFSQVLVKSSDSFVSGESFSFAIEVYGNDIDFPQIQKIDKYSVMNLGTNQSITSINGNVTRIIKKSFSILPDNDFILPSFIVKVDGKEYKTKEKSIKQIFAKKTKSKDFDLEISTLKSSLFVGEDTILKLRFKYRKNLQIVDLDFTMPTFKNIWMKKIDNQKSFEENGFVVQELEFLIFPQKSGTIELAPIKIDAKVLDSSFSSFSMFSNPSKNIKIYSNKLSLEVKQLPQNVNLIGEFLIKTSISKDKINSGESVSYIIDINGYGNIDDIEDIKIEIANATIYENKPKVQTKIENNKYIGSYQKSFSILSNEDFVIPSYELKYYDKNIQKVVSQKTKEYQISVKSIQKEENLLINNKPIEKIKIKEVIVNKSSLKDRIIFFILGFIFALLIIGLYIYVKNINIKRKDDSSLIKLIKKSKSKDEMMKIIIPYISNNNKLDDIIFKLDASKNGDFNKEKKEILEVLKSLNL